MPELPEIETIRRGLGPLLVGRRVLHVLVRERRLREPLAPRGLARLRGATVTGIRRRSKYLLLDTDSGLTLLIHLGMTGQLWVADRGKPRRPHEHVVISLDDGRDLRYADIRRFGLMHVVRSDRLDLHPRLKGLGPEPLDGEVTGETLFRATRGLKKPVKNFLMDTRAIAGVGNIYACETLYRAGISPRRSVGRLGRPGWEGLMVSLRALHTRSTSFPTRTSRASAPARDSLRPRVSRSLHAAAIVIAPSAPALPLRACAAFTTTAQSARPTASRSARIRVGAS